MSAGTLRPMASNDLELILAWRNHPDVRRYMYTNHVIPLAEHQAWYEKARQQDDVWLLVFELNGIPTGFVNISQTRSSGVADWGFYLAPESPKGAGVALGSAALNYAFNELGLHKVCGQALGFNTRSLKFHGRLGFEQEGVLRDQHFDGERYHDVICFGILAAEWQVENY